MSPAAHHDDHDATIRPMRGIRRAMPHIVSDRVEESRAFYAGFLGFREAMDMGWIITFGCV